MPLWLGLPPQAWVHHVSNCFVTRIILCPASLLPMAGNWINKSYLCFVFVFFFKWKQLSWTGRLGCFPFPKKIKNKINSRSIPWLLSLKGRPRGSRAGQRRLNQIWECEPWLSGDGKDGMCEDWCAYLKIAYFSSCLCVMMLTTCTHHLLLMSLIRYLDCCPKQ